MDTVGLTLAEAAAVLDPPMTETQLHAIVGALAWKPAGVRRNGCPGRPKPTYPAGELMRLHAALTPWLTGNCGSAA